MPPVADLELPLTIQTEAPTWTWTTALAIGICVFVSITLAAFCVVLLLFVRLQRKHRLLTSEITPYCSAAEQRPAYVSQRQIHGKAHKTSSSAGHSAKARQSSHGDAKLSNEQAPHERKIASWWLFKLLSRWTKAFCWTHLDEPQWSPSLYLSESVARSSTTCSAPAQWSLRDIDLLDRRQRHAQISGEGDPLTPHYLYPSPLFSERGHPVSNNHLPNRKARSQTIATVSEQQPAIPLKRSRSLCSALVGGAPVMPVPPLPPRCWSEMQSNSSKTNPPILTCSRMSMASVDSTGSSLLQGCSKLSRPSSVQMRQGAGRQWVNSIILAPISNGGFKINHSSGAYGCQKSLQSLRSVHSTHVRLSDCSSAAALEHSFAASRSSSVRRMLPKRLSRTDKGRSSTFDVSSPTALVMSSGEDDAITNRLDNHDFTKTWQTPSTLRSPVSSRASSTRSSNGDPFHWDPDPVSLPRVSAMKRSPDAKGLYRAEKRVRLSLQPTVYGSISSLRSSPVGLGISNQPLDKSANAFEHRKVRPRSLPYPPKLAASTNNCRTKSHFESSLHIEKGGLVASQSLRTESDHGDTVDQRRGRQIVRRSSEFVKEGRCDQSSSAPGSDGSDTSFGNMTHLQSPSRSTGQRHWKCPHPGESMTPRYSTRISKYDTSTNDGIYKFEVQGVCMPTATSSTMGQPKFQIWQDNEHNVDSRAQITINSPTSRRAWSNYADSPGSKFNSARSSHTQSSIYDENGFYMEQKINSNV